MAVAHRLTGSGNTQYSITMNGARGYCAGGDTIWDEGDWDDRMWDVYKNVIDRGTLVLDARDLPLDMRDALERAGEELEETNW